MRVRCFALKMHSCSLHALSRVVLTPRRKRDPAEQLLKSGFVAEVEEGAPPSNLWDTSNSGGNFARQFWFGPDFADLQNRVQLGDPEYFADVRPWIHQCEIKASGLQRNQQADAGRIDSINFRQIQDHIAPLLLNGGTQERGFVATYNSARTAQDGYGT